MRRFPYKVLSNFLLYHFQKFKFLNNIQLHLNSILYVGPDIPTKQDFFIIVLKKYDMSIVFYAKYGTSICEKT